LRVDEIGVGDWNGDVGPIRGEPAAEAVGVVAGAEVVVASFGVAFLAFELIRVLRASVGNRPFCAKGRKVGIVTECPSGLHYHPRAAQEIFRVVERAASSGNQRNPAASEEDVVVDGATYRVNWQAKDGGIDFRTHRNETFYSSSPLDEKRRNLKAAEIVAKRVCRSVAKLSVDTKDGDMWLWRFECG